MAIEAIDEPVSGWRQRRTIIGVFVALSALLALGYFFFLRTDYAVLYTDLKPADAAAIVAELDAKGIGHRLRDEGTTILVPVGDADTVRLAVAGSDIPLKGSVGFELFNKSDMGLTDFAQKINYQRALQGELARTIMMMDGVETARVHLAMPERSLFRGNRSTPKAAIEVITRPGQQLDAARVAGIQRLVASAVPDLALGEVAVLDGNGHVVSPAPTAVAIPEMEEQQAAQNYYRARAKSALANRLPGLRFDVKALMLPASGGEGISIEAAPAGPGSVAQFGKNGAGGRNFRLLMTVLTEAPLNGEDQSIARDAVASATGFDENRGDNIAFEQGPVGEPASPPLAMPANATVATQGPALPPPSTVPASGWGGWWATMLAGLFLVAGAILFIRMRRPLVSVIERDAFVTRIRQSIGASDARA
ncbi:flagellar M-ring protein FliF [Sphingomonas sp. So64.6b]|uniref:flagellar basal-body MS-ring/collar protein FliF n=1 Tax=Sphingomonas sp. So64.6b TaxID=2997354 RepID=UPI0016037B85|nr:flagellar basal-body MS-ring/collar protein FliF [Sphingomonas sp. So64.6b]QNA82928.1 flagellar M-ring protein FliF [Sphingomonas sp. So64.6b]